MTKLALIRIETGEVLSLHDEGAGGVDLPDGAGRVSPPVAGWEGGGEIITTVGPARFKMIEITPAEIPEGKRAAGQATYEIDGDLVREVVELEDIPPPPPPPTEGERVDAVLSFLGFASAEDFMGAVARKASTEAKVRG